MAFITPMGIVSLLSDMTHEGARSILGEYLNLTGASAATIGFVSGIGELCGYSLRLLCPVHPPAGEGALTAERRKALFAAAPAPHTKKHFPTSRFRRCQEVLLTVFFQRRIISRQKKTRFLTPHCQDNPAAAQSRREGTDRCPHHRG